MRAAPRSLLLLVVAVVALVAGACLPPAPAQQTAQPAPVTQPAPTSPPTTRAPVQPTTLPTAPGGASASSVIINPGNGARALDFPDPFVLLTNGVYYAYSTGSLFGPKIAVITSTDGVNWTWVGDAFAGGGTGWSDLPGTNTWGPSVLDRPGGNPAKRYVLYYASQSKVAGSNGTQCIGRAYSSSPIGPFVDEETTPFICTPSLGGSIDPSPIVVGNNVWLTWKTEGVSSPYTPTQIFSVPLTSDGLGLLYGPGGGSNPNIIGSSLLLSVDTSGGSWEFPIIEGPSMIANPAGSGYLLFYSAYNWESAGYKVGVASCAYVSGPCSRIYSTPVLATRGSGTTAMSGPGGQSVFQDANGAWKVAFHAWTGNYIGYANHIFDPNYARSLRFLPLTFPGGKPQIG